MWVASRRSVSAKYAQTWMPTEDGRAALVAVFLEELEQAVANEHIEVNCDFVEE